MLQIIIESLNRVDIVITITLMINQMFPVAMQRPDHDVHLHDDNVVDVVMMHDRFSVYVLPVVMRSDLHLTTR